MYEETAPTDEETATAAEEAATADEKTGTSSKETATAMYVCAPACQLPIAEVFRSPRRLEDKGSAGRNSARSSRYSINITKLTLY